jgi:hypothetical protein
MLPLLTLSRPADNPKNQGTGEQETGSNPEIDQVTCCQFPCRHCSSRVATVPNVEIKDRFLSFLIHQRDTIVNL